VFSVSLFVAVALHIFGVAYYLLRHNAHNNGLGVFGAPCDVMWRPTQRAEDLICLFFDNIDRC
jgi:hypothetical protein